MAKAENKTQATNVDVGAFLDAVEHPVRRADGLALDEMFRRVTGWQPRMWGPTIVGYGEYHYVYDSGREGDFLATGFGINAREFSIYILPGYTEFPDIAARLGKHKKGKSCWYIKRLSDIDQAALADLIRAGLADLDATWPVTAT